MSKDFSTYLVPVDFTPASVSATLFTIGLANNEKDSIILLHIIKSEREHLLASKTMDEFVLTHCAGNKNVQSKVVIGNVSEEIGEAAKILESDLIVLGTHCATGLGKLFNSYAFKIIDESPTPLLIVQEETSFQQIKKIVMTIDLERGSIQILTMAAHLSKLFNSEIILVAADQTDHYFKGKRDVNLMVCKKYLTEHKVPHSIEFIDGKHFVENIFKLCKEQNADMLAATYYQQRVHVFTDSFVRTLANNEFHLPLLTMSEEATHSGGQFGAMFG
jgi:nucleotide-binding universal stress UspA family protein